MRERRSILFYAWAGLAAQAVLLAGVIVFVLTGAAYQRAAIADLQQKAQGMQLANDQGQSQFLDAQRALRGFQASGQDRFLQTYFAEQDAYVLDLRGLRRLAWASVLGGVLAQGHSAEAAFLAGNQAVWARADSGEASRLYNTASAWSDRFVADNQHLQQRLARDSSALAARSERTLGVGQSWTTSILTVGLMLPAILMGLGLRWTSGPLHGVTTVVRRRALGDYTGRAVPGGPADIRDLAASVNFLSDESDRLMSAEHEHARLQAAVREAAIRIRGHLRAGDVIGDAVSAIRDHLAIDFAWIGLVKGDKLMFTKSDQEGWAQSGDVAGYFPPDLVAWLGELYRQGSSYCLQDLRSGEPGKIPPAAREYLTDAGAASLLLTPFGAGPELLGATAVARKDPGAPWTPAEIQAVESLAGDIGRGIEYARLYENEERLVADLKSVDRAKTSFLASASHDLRTPLTSIVGYVEMLADRPALRPPGPEAKMLEVVDRSARRLQALIEDMLTISKIELGAFTSNLRPVDLARVVADAADMIRPLAAEKGLSFEATCPDGALMVEGEAGQLARMLDNLLSNAVKYTPAGGSVTLAAARDGDWAVLSVADTGIGIPGPEQGSLFNRFFRASNAVDLAIPGSGLGLGIVRTIISNHHGDIGIESTEGASTTVTVRIPLRREGQAAGQDGARVTVPGETVPGGTSSGGTSPGETVPGGTSPGGTSPGETVPGGDIARGDSARGDSARGAVAAQGAREDSALPDGAAPGMAGLAGGPGGARPERDPLLAANRRRR